MAEKKYLDDNGLLYVWSKIKGIMPKKTSELTNDSNFAVDANYVHTDNNYTSTEKTKLSGVATGAQVNKIELVKVNGTALTIDSNKTVNVTVPTKTGDLTNNSNFVSDASYVHTDNNYTNTEKTKLNGVASGAQVNVIESVKVNGAATTISNKSINITVPTNTNQLTNGAGFQTASQVTTIVNNALADMTGIKFEIVDSLPTQGIVGTIYLVKSNTSDTNDVYDEYFWVASTQKYEFMGTTSPDLSNYLTFDDVVAITNSEIDTICT